MYMLEILVSVIDGKYAYVTNVKLIRTKYTFDLSQKAEKCMSLTCAFCYNMRGPYSLQWFNI